ncbi:MAG: hypothetical protein C0523_05725, partial [Cytophaga sp.]|nr:hypothetical protein [Cytophaga sp.]
MRYKLLLLFFLPLLASAQQKFTISGYVKDIANGEALIGATVFVKEINNGATTNEYGFYSITLVPGTYTVQYIYLGYTTDIKTITLDKNTPLNIELTSAADQLEEVVVKGEFEQPTATNLEMSTVSLSMKTIMKIPAFMGEVDVLRSIQLLP